MARDQVAELERRFAEHRELQAVVTTLATRVRFLEGLLDRLTFGRWRSFVD